jgi:hypothetical protein
MLGAGNYLRPHMPDWTSAVSSLYKTCKQEPWSWSAEDSIAWDAGMNCMRNLKALQLPSSSPDAQFEIYTDASDHSHASVLFQRQHKGTTGVEDLRLIQWDGGCFNDRQKLWTIHQREMYSVFLAFKAYHFWIRLHPVVLHIDNMLLTYMATSENPMIRRWFAYLQDYQFSIVHLRSEENGLVDAFSRLQHRFQEHVCIQHSADEIVTSSAIAICSPIQQRSDDDMPALCSSSDDEMPVLCVHDLVAPITRSGKSSSPPSKRISPTAPSTKFKSIPLKYMAPQIQKIIRFSPKNTP